VKPVRSSSLLVSVVVHVAIAAVVLPATLGTSRVAAWMGITLEREPGDRREERVRFVETVAEPRPEIVANGRDEVSGGKAAPPAPVLPPVEPPSADTPSDAVAAPSADGSDPQARGDGSGGPLEGIRPSFQDPRIWAVPWSPAPEDNRPTFAQIKSRVDSLIRVGALPKVYEDSLAQIYGAVVERAPGDWTMQTRNGERWGLDGGMIRLGKVSIPTALLALLPLNTGRINVQQMENGRRIAAMSADIRYHAQRAMNEDEFRSAVRRIRERKERERSEAQKRREESSAIAQPVTVPLP
jgi:hypothetical protein